MRVSLVLVSVNVAASLSVAAQPQAVHAQDKVNTSAADFLKSSLSGMSTSSEIKVERGLEARAESLRGPSKVSLSNPRSVSTRTALSKPGVKLRAFMPNRKLPSKKDLAAPLMEQQPQFDTYQPTAAYQPTSQLTGMIREYEPYYVSDDAHIGLTARAARAVKQQKKRVTTRQYREAAEIASARPVSLPPRVVPGQNPVMPGQVGFPCAEQPVRSMESVAHVPVAIPQYQAPMQPVQQQIQQQPIAAQDGPPVLPNLSPQEQAEMNRMIQQSCAEAGIPASNPAPQGDLYARIGAPPFPLNLVPEQAMKGFIKGARDRKPIATKPQGFGSWHGDMAGPVASGLPTALPAAGFRSYSQMGNGFKKYSRVPAQLSHKHQSSHSHKSHSSIAHSVPKVNRGIARKPKNESPSISMAQVTVYEYPPYHSDLHLDAR